MPHYISQRSLARHGAGGGRCKSTITFAALGRLFHYALYMGRTDDYRITNTDGTAVLVVPAGERQRPIWLPISLCS